MLRLLPVCHESIARVGLEDSELVPNSPAERGDGKVGARRGVRGQESPVVQVGQDVSVHHDEWLLGQIGEPAERPHRPQGRILPEIIDRDAPPLPVPTERLDQMTQVADANSGSATTGSSELIQHEIQYRSLAYGEQWLGQHEGVWRESGPASACEEDRAEWGSGGHAALPPGDVRSHRLHAII